MGQEQATYKVHGTMGKLQHTAYDKQKSKVILIKFF